MLRKFLGFMNFTVSIGFFYRLFSEAMYVCSNMWVTSLTHLRIQALPIEAKKQCPYVQPVVFELLRKIPIIVFGAHSAYPYRKIIFVVFVGAQRKQVDPSSTGSPRVLLMDAVTASVANALCLIN